MATTSHAHPDLIGWRASEGLRELVAEDRRQKALAARMTVNAALVEERDCPTCDGTGFCEYEATRHESGCRGGACPCGGPMVKESCRQCDEAGRVEYCTGCDDPVATCRACVMSSESSDDSCAVTLRPEGESRP